MGPEISSSNLQEKISNIVDADGDTQMSGINGISITTLTAIINAVNSQNSGKGSIKTSKPPAPWRSPEVFAALRAAGKCTRCEKNGHWHKKCPDFTWARRPSNINVIAASSSKTRRPCLGSAVDEEESGNE